MRSWHRYAAEAYGTFVLVGVGTGAIIASGGDLVVISLAFGLALIVGLYTVGRISGGHFNPAVTLAMCLDKRVGVLEASAYWFSQLAGALAASYLLAYLVGRDLVAQTVTSFDLLIAFTDEAALLGALKPVIAEAVLTAVFVLAVLALTKSAPTYSAFLGIGLTLAAVHLVGAPLTGASVNPARSFAPAFVSAQWSGIWVYIVGPAVGAIVAWAVYKLAFRGEGNIESVDDS